MRFRMGKGQVLVFDAFIEKTLDAMKAEKGFYPTLKEIGERCTPPQPAAHIHRSLVRLAQAGRLSREALRVYNTKNNIQRENDDDKRKSSKHKK